jgi:ribosomal protein S18 acetylase RimI-like enzyme
MINENELLWLDPTDSESVYQVAQLHKELLPDSPIPQFGDTFMTKFYYTRLISLNLINCLIYKHKSEVVGFITITRYPDKFMFNGFISNFIFIIYLFTIEIIYKPKLLFTFFNIIKLGYKRKKTDINHNTSELLSIGVKKKYRKLVDSSSKLRVSHTLFINAAKLLAEEGYEVLYIITDKNNDHAISFYKSLGVKLEKSEIYNESKQILFKLDIMGLVNIQVIKEKTSFSEFVV